VQLKPRLKELIQRCFSKEIIDIISFNSFQEYPSLQKFYGRQLDAGNIIHKTLSKDKQNKEHKGQQRMDSP
jgi:hypothetical protein